MCGSKIIIHKWGIKMQFIVKLLMGVTIGLMLGQREFEQIFREIKNSKGDE